MKKSKTAFLTTIFPLPVKYLEDFFKSLQIQTDADFDIIVINDGVANFNKIKLDYPDLNIIEVKSEKTPVENRIEGLKFVLKLKYENLIFGDSDDYFEDSRVQKTKNKLIKYDIVVNELRAFNDNSVGNNIFQKFNDNKTNFKESILSANIFGLSNTGIKVKMLKNISFKMKFDIVAFDWYLFTILVLLFSNKVYFLKESTTFYRQHEFNTVGIQNLIDANSLAQAIKIKSQHFKELKSYCVSNNYSDFSFIFEKELNKVEELKTYLKNDKQKKEYITIVNSNIDLIFKGWWSQVLPLEKYYKYKNNESRN